MGHYCAKNLARIRQFMNILITTYFRSEQLAVLLDSIRKQLMKNDRVIVVYQVSDQATFEVLHKCMDIVIIPVPFNETGAVKALVAGMEKVKPSGFLLLDDDVILPSDYLKRLRQLIDQYPNCIIAGTNLVTQKEIKQGVNIDQTISNGISNKSHPLGIKSFIGYQVGRFQEPFYGPVREIHHFQGCNVYIASSVVFPSSKFEGDSVYYEMSWAFKLNRKVKMLVKPDLTVLHVQPFNQSRVSSRDTNSLKRIYAASRNMSLVMGDISNPIERLLTGIWFYVIGQKPIYGVLRAIFCVMSEEISIKNAYKRFKMSRRGWNEGKERRYKNE
jgi:hypothetical protein